MIKESPIIVGIGASAGGLVALEEFFTHMPSDSGLAFVLIQHLSPDYKSMMAELLSKYTKMPVAQAAEGMEVEPDHVYLIPPKVNLTIENNTLHLVSRENRPHQLHLPIDIFFHSLAQNSGHKAIAVVLSGTGSDGTLGLRSIKEMGGMTLAQDPQSAKFDGMPNSAIHTELVDMVLPASEMPAHILRYVKHPFLNKEDSEFTFDSRDQEFLQSLLSLIKQFSGIDFSQYKLSTVGRRIERRMSILQIDKLKDYLEFVLQNKEEMEHLNNELLIGVTRFFRDPPAFEMLDKMIVPRLFERNDTDPIRVWVAGCSSGEEAYSVAILLTRFRDEHHLSREIKIFATDVDRRSLDIASTGRYPETIVNDVPKEVLNEYFIRRESDFIISEKIRRMIVFARHNLLKDPPFNKVDLIVCRNLLIYFRSETQRQILGNFSFALRQDGFLFLGASESLGEHRDIFHTLDSRWKLYQLKKGVPLSGFPIYSTPSFIREKRQHQQKSYDSDNIYLEDIREKLTMELIPPTLIVDEELNLLHTFNDVSDFLKIPVGRASLNLTRMLPNAIALMIRNGIRRANETNDSVYFTGLSIGKEEENVSFRIERHFLYANSQPVFSLTFYKNRDPLASFEKLHGREDIDTLNLNYQEELEKELRLTRENLQSTVEELETSNEELQATNEELMSSNEELQSTNEELQSVNEELFTVNSEYQAKIEELTLLNQDMENYMQSTQIGVLFLDSNLRIRKFTPSIRSYFPLLDQDVGRPLAHFAGSLNYANLEDDLLDVLRHLRPIEKDVVMGDHKTYQLRILPYIVGRGVVDGLTLTFVDITQRVVLEKELKLLNERYKMIVSTSEIAAFDWMNTAADLAWWSPELLELAGKGRDAANERPLSELWDLFASQDEVDRVKSIIGQLTNDTTRCQTIVELSNSAEGAVPGSTRKFVLMLSLADTPGPTRILGALTPVEKSTHLC